MWIQAELALSQFDCLVQFVLTAVPLYTRSKQARGYKAFTRQSCQTFPLCASAAGLRCIIHEHSVNLLIQNMSSLFLCLIYYLSFFHTVIPSVCVLLAAFLPQFSLLPFLISGLVSARGRADQIRRREKRKAFIKRWR